MGKSFLKLRSPFKYTVKFAYKHVNCILTHKTPLSICLSVCLTDLRRLPFESLASDKVGLVVTVTNSHESRGSVVEDRFSGT